MAWTAPLTWTSNTILSAALLNTHLRDNLNTLEPALATVVGSFFATSAANAIQQKTPDWDYIATSETTASAVFANLATVGPAVTVATSTHCLVFHRARMQHSVVNSALIASYAVSGATTRAATDNIALLADGLRAANFVQLSGINLFTDLTAGSNTFTMQYRTSAATATFSKRFIAAIPF